MYATTSSMHGNSIDIRNPTKSEGPNSLCVCVWLPCIPALARMSQPCITPQQAVLEFRLGYPPQKWRNVYKALTVLEFLLKRGERQSAHAGLGPCMRAPAAVVVH